MAKTAFAAHKLTSRLQAPEDRCATRTDAVLSAHLLRHSNTACTATAFGPDLYRWLTLRQMHRWGSLRALRQARQRLPCRSLLAGSLAAASSRTGAPASCDPSQRSAGRHLLVKKLGAPVRHIAAAPTACVAPPEFCEFVSQHPRWFISSCCPLAQWWCADARCGEDLCAQRPLCRQLSVLSVRRSAKIASACGHAIPSWSWLVRAHWRPACPGSRQSKIHLRSRCDYLQCLSNLGTNMRAVEKVCVLRMRAYI